MSEKGTWGLQKFTRRLEISAVLAEISKRLADFHAIAARFFILESPKKTTA
ncbi:MAG: hypothetical protein IIW37_00705 [Bacteroidaceae bacterium]|nr:hypothetical protein [Bacteroidaceae bacterium]